MSLKALIPRVLPSYWRGEVELLRIRESTYAKLRRTGSEVGKQAVKKNRTHDDVPAEKRLSDGCAPGTEEVTGKCLLEFPGDGDWAFGLVLDVIRKAGADVRKSSAIGILFGRADE